MSWVCVFWLSDKTVRKFQSYASRLEERSIRILFSERYVCMLTYSILNKNRIRRQTIIAQTANWFFATFVISLLSDSVVLNGQFT